MKNEIKEIIDRLERIDHKEYIAFEFADSATFDEVARCFEERKKMANYITNLQEEKKQLKDGWQQEVYDKDKILNDWLDLKVRNEKAIEYMNTHYLNANEPELLNILQGSDKDE